MLDLHGLHACWAHQYSNLEDILSPGASPGAHLLRRDSGRGANSNAACGTGTHTGTQDSNAYRCGKQSISGTSLKFRTQNTSPEHPAEREVRRFFSTARFLGCLPALQPVQLAIRVAKPPPVPSPRAWPLTSAPAIAARPAPTETPQARRENHPNIHRILPGDPPPGTTRILLEYCPTAARKATRILREYLANTSRAPSGSLRVCARFL